MKEDSVGQEYKVKWYYVEFEGNHCGYLKCTFKYLLDVVLNTTWYAYVCFIGEYTTTNKCVLTSKIMYWREASLNEIHLLEKYTKPEEDNTIDNGQNTDTRS